MIAFAAFTAIFKESRGSAPWHLTIPAQQREPVGARQGLERPPNGATDGGSSARLNRVVVEPTIGPSGIDGAALSDFYFYDNVTSMRIAHISGQVKLADRVLEIELSPMGLPCINGESLLRGEALTGHAWVTIADRFGRSFQGDVSLDDLLSPMGITIPWLRIIHGVIEGGGIPWVEQRVILIDLDGPARTEIAVGTLGADGQFAILLDPHLYGHRVSCIALGTKGSWLQAEVVTDPLTVEVSNWTRGYSQGATLTGSVELPDSPPEHSMYVIASAVPGRGAPRRIVGKKSGLVYAQLDSGGLLPARYYSRVAENGQFAFEAIRPGAYELEVAQPLVRCDFARAVSRVKATAPGRGVHLSARTATLEMQLRSVNGHKIRNPVAHVVARPPTGSSPQLCHGSRDGRISLRVPADGVDVVLKAPGYRDKLVSCEGQSNLGEILSITMEPVGGTGTIVVKLNQGELIDRVHLGLFVRTQESVEWKAVRTWREASVQNARLEILDVPAQEFVMIAARGEFGDGSSLGYCPVEIRGHLGAGETRTLQIEFEQGGWVDVVCLSERTGHLVSCNLEIVTSSGQSVFDPTLSSVCQWTPSISRTALFGGFNNGLKVRNFFPLPEGTYQLSGRSGTGAVVSRELRILAGTESECVIKLP